MQVCLECERPMRTTMEKAGDKPGTVMHYGRGLCKVDWKRLNVAGTLDTLYPPAIGYDGKPVRTATVPRDSTVPCEDCGKNMRPPGTTLTDWPDTVTRKGKTCGRCCHKRQQTRAGRPALVTSADIRKMREDLKDYFYSRGRDWRLAGIPA